MKYSVTSASGDPEKGVKREEDKSRNSMMARKLSFNLWRSERHTGTL